jgi:hypothetical protein
MLKGSGPVRISNLQVTLNMGCTKLEPSTNISPPLCWEHPVPNVEPAERRAKQFQSQTNKNTGLKTLLLQLNSLISHARLSRSVGGKGDYFEPKFFLQRLQSTSTKARQAYQLYTNEPRNRCRCCHDHLRYQARSPSEPVHESKKQKEHSV